MKFSILLPTRNRLEYLRLAVESVLRQDFDDWEIVISDNFSEDDIGGYVRSLEETRVVYVRTERPVPVTENWNRALAHSTGDYFIMLGDDDALLGGYLRHMDELTRAFGDPDLVYTKTLLFTYPGVDPTHPAGLVMDNGCAQFLAGASEPFVLDPAVAQALVRDAMSFRLRYDFNAQFALIGRPLIEQLASYGDFYQSAFPDYYSMNAAFLKAKRIVIDPSARVVVGVTPKSYGYFHVNNRETEGRSFLEGATVTPTSGTNINVGWLSAMRALEQGPASAAGLRVDLRRYRLVQAAHVYLSYRSGAKSRAEVRAFERELPLLERWVYRSADAALALVHRVLPARLKAAWASLAARRVGQLPDIAPARMEGRFNDVLELIDACGGEPGGRLLETSA
jgi:glycosyltransferase involved in cell wall biosynthesis